MVEQQFAGPQMPVPRRQHQRPTAVLSAAAAAGAAARFSPLLRVDSAVPDFRHAILMIQHLSVVYGAAVFGHQKRGYCTPTIERE